MNTGFRISPGQQALFFRLFAAAADCQKWHPSERETKRKELLSSLGFQSLKDVDTKDGFDAVKLRLEELSDTVHTDSADAHAGQRRRILWRVNQALEKLRAANYPERSIATILSERFKATLGVTRLEDLATEDLLDVSKTFTARLADWQLQSSFLEAALTIARIATLTGVQLESPKRRQSRSRAADPAHTLCSPIAADMQPQFFLGG